MNGKKSVSEDTFLKIANRLSLEAGELETLREGMYGITQPGLSFSPLEADHFQFISDWHYYAILEAFSLEDFEPSATWLASRLGISEHKARTALDRLLRLGILTQETDGGLSRRIRNHTTTHLTVPTAACREHERQVLELALRALDEVPVSERDQTSLTMAIPSSRVKEAREKIDQFRREMASLLQRRGRRDSIYHFSISFYPVTQFLPETPNKEKSR